MSPVLNAFIAQATNKQLLVVSLCFYTFQTLWGLTLSVGFIEMGYSVFSFIGIYILAQTLRRYDYILNNINLCVIIFMICCIVNFIIYYISSKFGLFYIRDMVKAYINPFVIIQAVTLFKIALLIPTIPFYKSRIFNWMSKSCFAVYLIHVGTPFALQKFATILSYINNNYNGIGYFALVFIFLIAIYIFAVIIDFPRRFFWDKLFPQKK